MKNKKLKLVQKINFRDYAATSGFNPYSNAGRVLIETLAAYSDCLPETVEIGETERNLKFFSLDAVSLSEAVQVMKLATPQGYNDFTPDNLLESLSNIFGETARVFIAREGSPCFYIKPQGNVWLNRSDDIQKIADEVSFVSELGAFRVWWD